MKHIFSFTEINYGSISIDSDHVPTEDEVINAIMEGSAFFKDTEYENIRLVDNERPTPKKRRDYER